jgi:hypothetical protein
LREQYSRGELAPIVDKRPRPGIRDTRHWGFGMRRGWGAPPPGAIYYVTGRVAALVAHAHCDSLWCVAVDSLWLE